jgi:hypothetical protein
LRTLFIGACGIGATLQDWLGFSCFIYRFRVPQYRRNPAGILPTSRSACRSLPVLIDCLPVPASLCWFFVPLYSHSPACSRFEWEFCRSLPFFLFYILLVFPAVFEIILQVVQISCWTIQTENG